MGLKNKVILFSLLFIASCNDIDTVELVPESPIAYEQCDRMCKKKFGERSTVYAVQKHSLFNELRCLCR
jgi:hypothetical protein